MAVFNFTVRATDSEGSFADRSFNINVRNSKIERYMVVNASNAFTSADASTWTLRTGMGGFSCAYGNGFWIILTSSGFRKSFDGVNYNSILLADTVWIDGSGNTITSGRTNSFTNRNPKIRFMNGKFVLPNWAAQSTAASTMSQSFPGIWISDDCVTWTFKPAVTTWVRHVSDNDYVQWIVSEDNGTIFLNCPNNNGNGNYFGWMTSDNGNTWLALRQVGVSSTTLMTDYVARFNGLYMVMQNVTSTSSSGPYFYSTDGQNWVAGTMLTGQTGATGNFTQNVGYQFLYANGRIITNTYRVGGSTSAYNLQTSVDGINWLGSEVQAFSNNTVGASNNLDSRLYFNRPVMAYKNGVYIIVHPMAENGSGSGLVQTRSGIRLSTNGTSWTTLDPNSVTPTAYSDVGMM